MPFAHAPSHLVASFISLSPHFSFPEGGPANEQIVLRWLHFVSGIIWIGLLYFFNLVGFATMKQLDAPVQAKVLPVLMTRAMWWFRWSALVTVVVGLRYYSIILSADAHNAGDPSLTLKWFGWWLLVWVVAFVADLSAPTSRQGNPRQLLAARHRHHDHRGRGVVARSRSQREPRILEQPSFDQRRRRHRPSDAAQRVGRRVARAEASDRMDARQHRARHADAARSRAPRAVVLQRFSRRLLALVPHALLHGRRRTLSIP